MFSRRFKLWLRRRFSLPVWLRELSFALLVGGIAFSYYMLVIERVLPDLEAKVSDTWFSLRNRLNRPPPPRDVLIISVDEESHAKLGVSSLEPWPRRLTAQLLEKLALFKPRAVFLDFSYSESRDPVDDQRLAAALKLSPTYLALIALPEKRVGLDGKIEELPGIIRPAPHFSQSAAGMFNAAIDIQAGIARYFSLVPIDIDSNKLCLRDGSNCPVTFAPLLFGDKWQEQHLPGAYDMINFYGPQRSVPSISFHEVINGGDEMLASISGKYVLVGQMLKMDYLARPTDTVFTPFGGASAGVEVHATIIANLLERSWIRSPLAITVVLAFMLTSLLVYSLFYLSAQRGLLVVIACMLGWSVVSYTAFLYGVFVPGAVCVFGLIPLSYALLSLRAHLRAKQLEHAMGLVR